MARPGRKPAGAPSAAKLPLAHALRQMGGELRQLSDMVQRMETAVDGMIERHAGALDTESIRNLQLLDILGQSLGALASFAENAASLARPAWTIDGRAATAGLTLASLAHRLVGDPLQPAAAAPSDCELFGGSGE